MFPLCVGKIVDKNGCNMDQGRKILMGECQPSILNSMLKLVDIGNRFRNIQEIKRYQFVLFLLRARKILNKKTVTKLMEEDNIIGRTPNITN